MYGYELDKNKPFDWNWKLFLKTLNESIEEDKKDNFNWEYEYVEEYVEEFIFEYAKLYGLTGEPYKMLESIRQTGKYKNIKL